MKSTIQKAVALTIALFFAVLTLYNTAAAKPADDSSLLVKNRIDLSSAGTSAVKTGVSGGMDLVQIKAVVQANTTSPGKVCSGNFKVKIEKFTGGGWVFHQHGGVANLCASSILRSLPTATLIFTDAVPANYPGAQKYRIVIDYTNWVAELSEFNNIDGTRYIP